MPDISALGNKAEQTPDHGARTESHGLSPHQRVWWGSGQPKRKWNLSLFLETVCLAQSQLIFSILWLQERRRPVFQSPGLRVLMEPFVSFLWGFSGGAEARARDLILSGSSSASYSPFLFKSHGPLIVCPGEGGWAHTLLDTFLI